MPRSKRLPLLLVLGTGLLAGSPAALTQGTGAEPAAPAAVPAPEQAAHRMVIHVDSADRDVMTEALSNAANVIDHYRAAHQSVALELVANGAGTHMLREDTSPVRDRLRAMHAKYPEIVFSACAISLGHMAKAAGHELALVPQARLVPSGAVRILELQEQRWSYMKP